MKAQPQLALAVRLLSRALGQGLARVALLSASLGLIAFGMRVTAQESGPSEYQVKAAYLVNFSKYVDWPPKAFEGSNAPLVIGIWGEDNFGEDLKKMTEGKSINGRNFLLKHVQNIQELKEPCQILFISASEKRRLPDILENLKGSSVLTVGETESFLPRGGIINFTRKDRKVRLEINLPAAERAGLKISSKLLSVAELIKSNHS